MKLKNASFREYFEKNINLITKMTRMIASFELVKEIDFFHSSTNQLMVTVKDIKDIFRITKIFTLENNQDVILHMPSGHYLLLSKKDLLNLYESVLTQKFLSPDQEYIFKNEFNNLFPSALYIKLRQGKYFTTKDSAISQKKISNAVLIDSTNKKLSPEALKDNLSLYRNNWSHKLGFPPKKFFKFLFWGIVATVSSTVVSALYKKKLRNETVENIDFGQWDSPSAYFFKKLVENYLQEIINTEQQKNGNLKYLSDKEVAYLEKNLDTVIHLIYNESAADKHDLFENFDLFYQRKLSPLIQNNLLNSHCFREEDLFNYIPIEESFRFIKKHNESHKTIQEPEIVRLSLLINLYCEKLNINPRMVLAIMATESQFSPKVIGKAGEYGLGQIMPSNLKTYGMSKNNACSIFLNTRATCYHLHRNFVNWKNSTENQKFLAIASYNGGRRKVKEAIKKNKKHFSLTYYAPKVVKIQKQLGDDIPSKDFLLILSQ